MNVKLYAETRRLRSRQIVLDVGVVVWTLMWIWLGMFAHDVIAQLAEPATAIAHNSTSLSESLAEISDTIDQVPLVGGALEEPFTSAADSAGAVAAESREQSERFHRAALWIGLLIAIAPIAAALLRYVPDRWRWVTEATAAARIRLDAGDLYLFALRAAANRSLSELHKVASDPGAALAAGDYERLARLELAHLGLKA